MAFSIRPGEGGVIHLGGEFDLSEERRFLRATKGCGNGQREVILDLTDVTFLDSSGLRAIAALSKDLAPKPIVLRGASGPVAKVLEIVAFSDAPGIRVE
jgi:anti-anti-sigma factor